MRESNDWWCKIRESGHCSIITQAHYVIKKEFKRLRFVCDTGTQVERNTGHDAGDDCIVVTRNHPSRDGQRAIGFHTDVCSIAYASNQLLLYFIRCLALPGHDKVW